MKDLLAFLDSHPTATAVLGRAEGRWICMIRGHKKLPSVPPELRDGVVVMNSVDVIKYADTAGDAIKTALVEACA